MLTFRTSASRAAQINTAWTGCRIDSRNALRAIVKRGMVFLQGAATEALFYAIRHVEGEVQLVL
jgi:hypothetical protein